MKIKHEMILAEVGDEYVAVTVGSDQKEFRGIVRLNETGKVIWEGISKGLNAEEIAAQLMEQYEVDEATAARSVDRIIRQLTEAGIVED